MWAATRCRYAQGHETSCGRAYSTEAGHVWVCQAGDWVAVRDAWVATASAQGLSGDQTPLTSIDVHASQAVRSGALGPAAADNSTLAIAALQEQLQELEHKLEVGPFSLAAHSLGLPVADFGPCPLPFIKKQAHDQPAPCMQQCSDCSLHCNNAPLLKLEFYICRMST